MGTTVVQFEVIGEEKIHCEGCESRIANALRRLQGVEEVQASAQTQRVNVTIDPATVSEGDLRARLEQIGYRTAYERQTPSFRRTALGAGVALLVLGAIALWQWQWDMSPLQSWIEQHKVLGGVAYLAAVVASVVLLPLSSLPLLPFVARLYGVWVTALLSAGGWWIGSLIAFQLARLGRRYLERFTSLAAVDRLEDRIPRDIGFGGIVILRMIFPVDIVSFALGLLKHLRFSTYAIASLIGIVPFSFVLTYAGGALGAGRFLTFAAVALALTAAVLVLRRLWRSRRS